LLRAADAVADETARLMGFARAEAQILHLTSVTILKLRE
jgi:hypothetical protein